MGFPPNHGSSELPSVLLDKSLRCTFDICLDIYWRVVIFFALCAYILIIPSCCNDLESVRALILHTHCLRPQDEQAQEQQDVTLHGEDRRGV